MIFEWIIVILSLVISIIFFGFSMSFPELAADPGGPALFPKMMAVLTGISAIFLGVQLLYNDKAMAAVRASITNLVHAWTVDRGAENATLQRRTVYTVILAIIYPYTILKIGFTISSIVFVFIIMRIYKSPLLKAAFFSLLAGLVLYYAFAKLLGAYVPTGEWIELLFV
jgi:hypothetical protein